MLADLALAMGEYERSEESRCAVLFAHGEHFTAGLDLMELAPKLAAGARIPAWSSRVGASRWWSRCKAPAGPPG